MPSNNKSSAELCSESKLLFGPSGWSPENQAIEPPAFVVDFVIWGSDLQACTKRIKDILEHCGCQTSAERLSLQLCLSTEQVSTLGSAIRPDQSADKQTSTEQCVYNSKPPKCKEGCHQVTIPKEFNGEDSMGTKKESATKKDSPSKNFEGTLHDSRFKEWYDESFRSATASIPEDNLLDSAATNDRLMIRTEQVPVQPIRSFVQHGRIVNEHSD
eukprot:Filipodium_phascolosomae@DN444_c0_g1_i1.p1